MARTRPPAGAVTGRLPEPLSTGQLLAVSVIVLALVVSTVLVTTGLQASYRERERRTSQAVLETVEDYLAAVAEGDAARARSHLYAVRHDAVDDSLLTGDVLRAARERAPMSDITVKYASRYADRPDAYYVMASYVVADLPVSAGLTVYAADPDEEPAIASCTRLWLDEFEGIDVTVNGFSPESSSPLVFPGIYTLAFDNEYLEITDADIEATDPSHDHETVSSASLVITEAGVQMFRDKVVAAAEACLASTSLDPGCGIQAPERPYSYLRCDEVREDSAQRWQEPEQAARLHAVTPEPLNEPRPVIGAHPYDLGSISATIACRDGDTWKRLEPYDGRNFGAPSIDLRDPELRVVWDG